MDDAVAAVVAKALAHPVRLRILRLLASQTECRGTDVFAGIPLAQSTISEHLRVLKDAGVVCSRTEGTAALYCLVPAVLEDFLGTVANLKAAGSACDRVEPCDSEDPSEW